MPYNTISNDCQSPQDPSLYKETEQHVRLIREKNHSSSASSSSEREQFFNRKKDTSLHVLHYETSKFFSTIPPRQQPLLCSSKFLFLFLKLQICCDWRSRYLYFVFKRQEQHIAHCSFFVTVIIRHALLKTDLQNRMNGYFAQELFITLFLPEARQLFLTFRVFHHQL